MTEVDFPTEFVYRTDGYIKDYPEQGSENRDELIRLALRLF